MLAQAPIRAKGRTLCPSHVNNEVLLVCEDCKELVCLKCISTVHKGHSFVDLKDFMPRKRKEVKLYTEKTARLELAQLKQDIEVTKANSSKNWKHLDDLATKIRQNGNDIKLQVDMFIEQGVGMCEELKHENLKATRKVVTELQTKCRKLEKKIPECIKTLQSGTYIDIYDIDTGVTPRNPVPKLATAEYIPASRSKEFIKKAFGRIEKIIQSKTSVYRVFDGPDKSFDIYDINSTYSDAVWVCCKNSTMVTQIDEEGVVLEQIGFDKQVNSVSVSPKTRNLWALCGLDGYIFEVTTPGKPSLRIKTDLKGYCLCVLRSDNIMVGMPNRISMYSSNGTLLSAKTIKDQKGVLLRAHKIAECPTTKNIAVTIINDPNQADSSVMIMDSSLVKLYDINFPTSVPWDVAYDTMGNLVVNTMDIIEKGGVCIYYIFLLDGSGTFRQILHKRVTHADDNPPVISIDNKNRLWTVMPNNEKNLKQIQILEYSTVEHERNQN